MKKFNGMESSLIIEALNYYVKQVEKDILEAEKDGKISIFASTIIAFLWKVSFFQGQETRKGTFVLDSLTSISISPDMPYSPGP